MKFSIILIFLLNIIKDIKPVIIIPFKRIFYTKLTEENIMEELTKNYLQVPFYVGEPIQEIPMILKLNEFPTFLTSIQYDKNIIKFDEKKSLSFKMINGHKGIYDTYDFTEGILSNDSLDFGKDQKKMKNFTFVLALNLTYQTQNFSGEIGLKLSSSHHSMPYTSSFINQLKSKDVIENYPFAIHYTDEDSGNFIFGNYLHNYDKNYIEDDFIYSKIGIPDEPNQWNFFYRNIKINDKYIDEREHYISFLYEYGIIESSFDYYKTINDSYFQDYLNKGVCKQKNFGYWQYYYIVCDTSINLKNFPEVVFIKDELNYNISLGYKELFYKFQGKYYFLVTSKNGLSRWIFGKPFFKKYLVFFDRDRKIFGLYPKVKYSSKFSIAWIIVIILSIALLGTIIFVKYYIPFTKRKIRANELEDEYDYTPQLLKNNNGNINKILTY